MIKQFITYPLWLFAIPGLLAAQQNELTVETMNVSGNLVVDTLTISSSPGTLPDLTNEDPVASFTSDYYTGDAPLGVSVDASASTDSDGVIVSYSWNWGDGTSSGTGVTTTHTYTTAGVYNLRLTVTDDDGATDFIVSVITVNEPSFPSTDMVVAEQGWNFLSFTWTDTEAWDDPWIIQRSTTPTFTTPTDMMDNQAADNTGAGTFRFLGINANNYIDNDGLAPGTTYYYRVGVCTNLSAHYQSDGVTAPTFGTWLYGTSTTLSKPAAAATVYNVTQAPYNAVAGDGNNDYTAIQDALDDAAAAGGGIIYMPAGTYDIWPTDPDVDIVGGIPTLAFGETATSRLFLITSDDITFRGDESGGAPTTFWNLYLWGKEPATDYLSVLDSGGSEVNARRYFCFYPQNIENFTVENIDVDMGANPVNSGKEWYSLAQKKTEWDISHKFFASHGPNFTFRNAIFDNVRVKNCRGEIIYNGGGGEKILVKDCILAVSNSSSISGSFDLEVVNTTIRDSANSAVESAIFGDQTSAITGLAYRQNHIARGCTFIGLDQSGSGVMKNVSGLKNFALWHCFNEEDTYQTVTDCDFIDPVASAFGPWYEYRNGLRFNTDFYDMVPFKPGNMIYTWTSAQGSYTIDGGMSEILWLGDEFHIGMDYPNYQVIFYSQPGSAANGSETPWTWEAVHFTNVDAGSYQINRLWVDTWNQLTGRDNALFKDGTKDAGITFDAGKYQFLGANHIDPTYTNWNF